MARNLQVCLLQDSSFRQLIPGSRGFDTDGNGTLEQSELSRALDRLQYNLSPRIVQAVLIKYGPLGQLYTIPKF
jgi:hypothetical protein